MANKVLLRRAFGPTGGEFVDQLLFWCSRSKHAHEGRRWVYNTQEEWARRLRVSPRHMKREIERLRNQGVVLVHRCASGHTNARINWYALDKEIVASVCKNVPYQGPKMSPIEGEKCPLLLRTYKSKTAKRKTSEADAIASAGAEAPKTEDPGVQQMGPKTKIVNIPAEQIVEAVKKKARKPSTNNPGALHTYWVSLHAESGWPGFKGAPTGKELGMLKVLRKKVGDDLIQPVLEFAVRHWPKVVKAIKHQYNVGSLPLKPDIGCLLLYAEAAVDALKAESAPDPQVAPTKVSKTIKMAPTGSQEPPMTLAELLEIEKSGG